MAKRRLGTSQVARFNALLEHSRHELGAIAGGDLNLELSIGRRFADEIAPVEENKWYHQSVFINCPFDEDYKPLFQAAAFTVTRCGYIVRCATEKDTSGEPRLQRILGMIQECRFGIHDLSRIHGYPRYNMPFELGLFVGAKRYGRGAQDQKDYLVFERDPNTYDRFISDFSGHDAKFHENRPRLISKEIRDWLSSITRKRTVPGIEGLWAHYAEFKKWLLS